MTEKSTSEVLAETIREAAKAEPYGVDDAQEILGLLRHSPTDSMLLIAMRLNQIYARGMNDAAKICEGKLLDDREPVGGTDAE